MHARNRIHVLKFQYFLGRWILLLNVTKNCGHVKVPGSRGAESFLRDWFERDQPSSPLNMQAMRPKIY